MVKKIRVDKNYYVFHAFCNKCDFEVFDEINGPREARRHIKETGHSMGIETGVLWSLDKC